MHHPVIETGACPWKGHMLPLHQWCIRAAAGIEPTTSSTQRKNHTPRPSGRANTEDRTQHLSRVKGAS